MTMEVWLWPWIHGRGCRGMAVTVEAWLWLWRRMARRLRGSYGGVAVAVEGWLKPWECGGDCGSLTVTLEV